ncbi:MAG: methylmalonyl-CoA epimerase [Oligoflexia bacterium]|nr:methylmalonyl-CoA epimerase [Oligoflexia bacterium]MBF0365168.1 methylmalonyl-CoA epimerase [Oligoflexia bacterium]
MIQKIDHIGIAVKSLEKWNHFYGEVLGFEYQGEEEVPSQGVRVSFFSVGEIKIELLMPLHEDSNVAKFLQQKGEGIHHIAYFVEGGSDHLTNCLATIKAEGFIPIHEIPIEGAHHKKIAFLHPKHTGGTLIELCTFE